MLCSGVFWGVESLPGVVVAAVVTGVVVTLLPLDVDAEGGLTVSL